MSKLPFDENRSVIPRWNSFEKASKRRECSINARDQEHLHEEYKDPEDINAAWRSNRLLPFAGDAVSAAISSGKAEEAIEAAQYLLASAHKPSPAAIRVARSIIATHESDQSELYVPNENKRRNDSIREYKRIIRLDPRNAIAYTDIALEYTILGQPDKALTAIQTALKLKVDNRHVLRSASRMFIHRDDLAKAHYIIKNSPRTQSDPWLLAAEIAVAHANGKSSRLIKIARSLLSSKRHDHFELAELASALATVEQHSGSHRKAAQLLLMAQVDPTENAAAQILWLARRDRHLELHPNVLGVPRAYEARAWQARKNGEWADAIRCAELWSIDQPFSSRPLVLGSALVLGILQDFSRAANICRAGLISNPGHTTLLNNLAVSLADAGDLSGAIQTFNRIHPYSVRDNMKIALLATRGLLDFRSGHVDQGRRGYLDAIEMARKEALEIIAAHAAIRWAHEEIRSASSNELKERAYSMACDLSAKAADPMVALLLERLRLEHGKLQGSS